MEAFNKLRTGSIYRGKEGLTSVCSIHFWSFLHKFWRARRSKIRNFECVQFMTGPLKYAKPLIILINLTFFYSKKKVFMKDDWNSFRLGYVEYSNYIKKQTNIWNEWPFTDYDMYNLPTTTPKNFVFGNWGFRKAIHVKRVAYIQNELPLRPSQAKIMIEFNSFYSSWYILLYTISNHIIRNSYMYFQRWIVSICNQSHCYSFNESIQNGRYTCFKILI